METRRKSPFMRVLAGVLSMALTAIGYPEIHSHEEHTHHHVHEVVAETVETTEAAEESEEPTILTYDAVNNLYYDAQGDVVEVIEELDPYLTYQPTNYPKKYSLVDQGVVTSVKNQGTTQTCWAHALLASAETYMIMHDINDATTSIDLSEAQLAWFLTNPSKNMYDPLYMDAKKQNSKISSPYNYAASTYEALSLLARGTGAIDEGKTGLITSRPTLNESIRYQSDIILVGSTQFEPSEREQIKQYVMTKSPVMLSFNSNDHNKTQTTEYKAFYQPTYRKYSVNNGADGLPNAEGHSVVIVGWDDEFSKENFTSGDNGEGPSYDGAWLCKNSWGSSETDDGYIWISYYDAGLHSCVGIEVAEKDSYDHIYQYDGIWTNVITWGSPFSFANVFTAQRDEAIVSAGVLINDANTDYTVTVYKNVKKGNPTSGTKMTEVSGTLAFAGYHMVEFEEPIFVEAGENFSIVVKLERTGSTIKLRLDNYVYADNTSYTMSSESKSWTNRFSSTLSNQFNAPVKAYTQHGIPLTAQTFPDTVFRDHLSENYDKDGDGMLSDTEIASITTLDVEDLGIADLTGIAHLTELKYLYCGGNSLTHLNLDSNTKLVSVSGNNTKPYDSFVCTSPLLPEGMDISRITNLTGAKILNGKLVPLQQLIQYSYSCSSKFKINVALSANSFNHDGLGSWTDAGSTHRRICEGCKETLSATHSCGEWEKYSSTQHSMSCMYCNYIVYGDHALEEWEEYTATLHRSWCSECTYFDTQLHDFTNWESVGNDQMQRHCIVCGYVANKKGLPIDETTFPDAVFRNYVSTNLDTNGDGILFDTELSIVMELDLDAMNISTLEGISCFYNLRELSCSGNTLSTLDLSGNPLLESLDCSGSQVETLILTGCSSLAKLICENNLLTTIDLADCTSLSYFDGDQNAFMTLELHTEKTMTYFSCENCVREMNRVSCKNVSEMFTDFSRISEPLGFVVVGSQIIPTASNLTYVYDCGSGCSATFTIDAVSIYHSYQSWTEYSETDHIQICRYCRLGRVEDHVYGSWVDNGDGTHTKSCQSCTNTVTDIHDYSSWTDVGNGTHRMKCGDCSAEIIEDHNYSDWTANEDGTHSRYCLTCNATEGQLHQFSDWRDQGAASHGRSCTVCGEPESAAHTFTAWEDSERNYHQRSCTDCGRMEYNRHECAGWVDNGNGTWTQSCTTCDFTETTEHQYSQWIYEDSNGHYRTCAICEEKQTESHNDTDYVNFGDGRHSNSCPTCGVTRYSSHTFTRVDNGDGTHTKTCTECDEVVTETHNYGDWFGFSESAEHYAYCQDCTNLIRESHVYDTCEDLGDGTHTQLCSVCGITLNSEHTLEYENNADGTHTASCLFCDFTESASHAYGIWEDDGEGSHIHGCLYCDATESEAHQFGKYSSTADGKHTRTCSVCQTTESNEHTFIDIIAYNDTGHTYECTFCKITELVPHNYSTNVTGEENGHQYTCEDCEYIKTEEHIFTEWINVGNGMHRSICDACSVQTTEEHEYGDWTDDGDGWHSHSCFCGALESSGHRYREWTETADGQHYNVCELCDAEVQGDHVYGNWSEDGDGNHVKTCSICKKAVPEEHPLTYVNNKDGTHTYHCKTCNLGETVEHEFSDWMDEGNGWHYRECACGEEESTGHKFETWMEINGQHANTCTVCGADVLGDHVYGSWADDRNGNHVRSCITCRKKQTESHVYTYVNNADGTHTYSCTCGLKKTEEHVFGDWTDDGDGWHSHVCVCGEKESTGHKVGIWMCTETTHSNTCEICGAEIYAEHAFTDWTKTRTGTYERSCITCKYKESRLAGDTDADQTWTAFDLTILKLLCQNMDEEDRPITADFNLDRKVNIDDIKALQAYLLGRET